MENCLPWGPTTLSGSVTKLAGRTGNLFCGSTNSAPARRRGGDRFESRPDKTESITNGFYCCYVRWNAFAHKQLQLITMYS